MKNFVLCFCLTCCSTILLAQKSKENILKSYRLEGRMYFDSLAKSKNNAQSSVQAEKTYNEARLEKVMKKVSDSLSTITSGDKVLMENLDKAIKREINPPVSYFNRVRKRIKG